MKTYNRYSKRTLLTTFMTSACVLSFISGCTHNLQIVNLNRYTSNTAENLTTAKSVGVSMSINSPEHTTLLDDGVRAGLKDYADRVGSFNTSNKGRYDVLADVSLLTEHNGSAANFFISWPGFVIFAPAWNGYHYEIRHRFDVKLSDPQTGIALNSFSVPVDLDVRHADFDRTFWSEGMGWLGPGWSAIALISAPFHCIYDPDVTPLAARKAARPIGSYVARQIADHINRLPAKGNPVTPAEAAHQAAAAPLSLPAQPAPTTSSATETRPVAQSENSPLINGEWQTDAAKAYALSRTHRIPMLVFAYASGVDQERTEEGRRLLEDRRVSDFAKGWLILCKIDLAAAASSPRDKAFASQLVQNNAVDIFPFMGVLNGAYKADYTLSMRTLGGSTERLLAELQNIKKGLAQ